MGVREEALFQINSPQGFDCSEKVTPKPMSPQSQGGCCATIISRHQMAGLMCASVIYLFFSNYIQQKLSFV